MSTFVRNHRFVRIQRFVRIHRFGWNDDRAPEQNFRTSGFTERFSIL